MSMSLQKKAKAIREQGNIDVYFLYLQYIVFLMKIIRDSSVSRYALRR